MLVFCRMSVKLGLFDVFLLVRLESQVFVTHTTEVTCPVSHHIKGNMLLTSLITVLLTLTSWLRYGLPGFSTVALLISSFYTGFFISH